MLYSCTHMSTVGIKGLQCYRMIRVNFSSPTMMTGLLKFTQFIRRMQNKCQAPANHQPDLGWQSTCRLLWLPHHWGQGISTYDNDTVSSALPANTSAYCLQDGRVVHKCRHSTAPGQHTACQPHRTTVGVIYALLYLDDFLFHARRLTTGTAVSLSVVRPSGTVY